MFISLAEGQVALCPAVSGWGRDLVQRDPGPAAGNSHVLNAELMAENPPSAGTCDLGPAG